MDEGWMEIVNIDKLVDFSRRVIFYNFDEANDDLDDEDFMKKIEKIESKDSTEMDKVLPRDEVKAIFSDLVFKKRNKNTKKIALFIKEEDYEEVLAQLNQRMVSNIVKGLVSRGLVESAFDSEKNDFVFWVRTDYDDRKRENPETD
jgi:Mg/Co/Ni transporter MgtE